MVASLLLVCWPALASFLARRRRQASTRSKRFSCSISPNSWIGRQRHFPILEVRSLSACWEKILSVRIWTRRSAERRFGGVRWFFNAIAAFPKSKFAMSCLLAALNRIDWNKFLPLFAVAAFLPSGMPTILLLGEA